MIFEVKTPGKGMVRLDDKAGTVIISDDNKNSITLSSSGITVDSAENLFLKAAGDITIQAGGALNITPTSNTT